MFYMDIFLLLSSGRPRTFRKWVQDYCNSTCCYIVPLPGEGGGSTFMQNVVEVLYYAEAVKQASYSKHWYCGRWTCSIALIMCVVMLIDISPTLSTSLFIKQ